MLKQVKVTDKMIWDNLKENSNVARNPCGRWCRVVKKESNKVKINDCGFWTGWVTKKNFLNKWHSSTFYKPEE